MDFCIGRKPVHVLQPFAQIFELAPNIMPVGMMD